MEGRQIANSTIRSGAGNEKGGHRFLPSLPNREPLGLRSKPRRQCVAANGASGLATGQPRKSEAALVVDWFYCTASLKWLPPQEGID